MIRGAGGLAAWAHPPHDLRESRLKMLVDQGLYGIEVDGPGFSSGKSQRLRAWALRFGLVGTAGSDFHAADRPGRWVAPLPPRSLSWNDFVKPSHFVWPIVRL